MYSQELGNYIQEIVKTEYKSRQKAIEAENELLKILPIQQNPYRWSGKTTFSAIKRMGLISLISTIIVLVIFTILATFYHFIILFFNTYLTEGFKAVTLLFFSVIFIILSIIIFMIISNPIVEAGKKRNNTSRLLAFIMISFPWILIGLFTIIGQLTDPIGFGLISENLVPDQINTIEDKTVKKESYYRLILSILFLSCISLLSVTWDSVEQKVFIPNFDQKKQKYYDVYQSKKLPILLAPKIKDVLAKLNNYGECNNIENKDQCQFYEELKEIIDSLPEKTKDENFVYIIFYKFTEEEYYHKGYIEIIVNFKLNYYSKHRNNQLIKWCCFSKEFSKTNIEAIYSSFKPILSKINSSLSRLLIFREKEILRNEERRSRIFAYILISYTLIMVYGMVASI